MSDSRQAAAANTVAGALDKAIDHIASAHQLVDRVRSSAQASGESPQLQKEVDRVWHALEIAGVLTTQLVRQLEASER